MDDKPATSTHSAPIHPAEAGAPVMGTEARRRNKSLFWFWLCIILVILVLIIGIASSLISVWLRNVKPEASQTLRPVPITTLSVQRTAPYAGLAITVINAQYALYFVDDTAHPVPATVRLNVQITSHNNSQSKVAYYDSMHLLIPGSASPVALSNTNLPTASIQSGAKVTGWLDFAVAKGTQLDMLTLQIGSAITSESLVGIPMKAPFDASRYADKTYAQSSTFSFNWNGHILLYHLTNIEVRYAYQGSQAKVGQQFYVFDFTVDNPTTIDAAPGNSLSYLRLTATSYNQPPIDSNLPGSFKAGTSNHTGYVVFAGPANMHTFMLDFLSPNSSTAQSFNVNI
jgi:hypothetical protein